MTPLHRRVVEVDDDTELARLLRCTRSMTGWHVRGLDLRAHREQLLATDPAGALLLGCTLDAALAAHFADGGALVLPSIAGAVVDEYRSAVYTPDELYAGLFDGGYADTMDARLYGWAHQVADLNADPALVAAAALHDASIDMALTSAIDALGRPVAGVMGGHSVRRGSDEFTAAARLGHRLAGTGFTVATGGGPGSMEAANLGAYLAGYDEAVIDEACARLAETPSFVPSIDAWARAAFAVRRRWPDGRPGIAVPTWHYGHEPPNAFASAIAKFFQNSVREATLLQRCDGGIVFLPGAAGTVQEVFQDACENYYAGVGLAAPMVLVGVHHWTETLPVYPLLRALAERGEFADQVHLVDDVASAVAMLAVHVSDAVPASRPSAVAEPAPDRT